ncbi:MAG: AmmeMemoRadiSam system protein B [Thermoplasmata archaeon]|nr:AmmeMemoRadiSam system protein B [Thermoplasmata archaeon]
MRRPADFLGSWYPGSAKSCRKQIEEFLEEAEEPKAQDLPRIGGIVPHAGWVFSGSAACNVFKALKKAQEPATVVIFGRHTSPFGVNTIMKSGAWETPLGDLEIDTNLAKVLMEDFRFSLETVHDYSPDNTIELQLPFIKYFFPNAKIMPIGIPIPSEENFKIGRKLAEIITSSELDVRVIGSTDLTHYGPNYDFTTKGIGKEAVAWVKNTNDKKMCDLFEAMQASEILKEAGKNSNACCNAAVATAIVTLKNLGAKRGEVLRYYTSYDIQPGSSFVGYAGVIY